jgi:hypothetical protein
LWVGGGRKTAVSAEGRLSSRPCLRLEVAP